MLHVLSIVLQRHEEPGCAQNLIILNVRTIRGGVRVTDDICQVELISARDTANPRSTRGPCIHVAVEFFFESRGGFSPRLLAYREFAVAEICSAMGVVFGVSTQWGICYAIVVPRERIW